MRPVFQTILGNEHGNCFAVCVASVLGFAVEAVPNFCDAPDPWFDAFDEWLRERDVHALNMGPPLTVDECAAMPELPYIACGEYEGPTGNGPHAVVHQRGLLVHNPNPTHEGRDLVRVDTVIFLVRAP